MKTTLFALTRLLRFRVKNFFAILRHVWFLVLFLLISYLVLNNVDQAIDTISDVITRSGCSQEIFLYAALTVFAFSVWYSARVMLMLADIEYVNPIAIIRINKWLPRVMGLAAYWGLFHLLLRIRCDAIEILPGPKKDPVLYGQLTILLKAVRLHLWLTPLCAAGYFAFVIFRRWHASDFRFRPKARALSTLSRTTHYSIDIILFVMGIFLFMFCFRTPGTAMARTIGGVNVILFALSIYAVGGMALLYFQYRSRYPFTLVLFLYVVGISYCNNNHQVRLTGDTSQVAQRKPVKEAFTSWIEKRGNDSTDYPVFIVAAEGGGIRAALFTAYTMAYLDSVYPEFNDHVFAISSVSGGSLGASLYCALQANDGKGKLQADSVMLKAGIFLQEDFLAPLNSAFVFADFVQKFYPCKLHYLDRSQWLEDSWSQAYLELMNSDAFEKPVFDLYRHDGVNVPHLFINSTNVESGRKAIYSDLNINADTAEYFQNDIDLAALNVRPVALKTATSMSARFPFLTPSATVAVNGKDIGNFVDGGYADNSGLGTAVSVTNILNTLKDSLKNFKYTVHVIELKNSATHKAPKPLSGIYEIRTVLGAFYNAWDNDVNRVMKNAKSYFHFNKSGGEFIPLMLDRSIGIMPLGWDLSDQAYIRMCVESKKAVKDSSGLLIGHLLGY